MTGRQDDSLPENVKQVPIAVPLSPSLHSLWSPSECSPCRLLSLPARFFGYGSHTTASLWMLSVCLAEIEKHKGSRTSVDQFRAKAKEMCLEIFSSKPSGLFLCLQGLKPSQLLSASLLSLRSLCWYQAKGWSSFGRWTKTGTGRLPKMSASLWSKMEAKRLWWDVFSGLCYNRAQT